MDKKPVIIFTCADKNNFPYSVMMLNSLRKFHDWSAILVTDEKDPEKLKLLPKDVEVVDLVPYLQKDPMFFYRQKPTIAEPLMKEYELVLGMDSDQIVMGDLSYILDTKDYDVGTVINWNRVDPETYGTVQGWGINPIEYFNCGLVAMRSEKFVHHWNVLSFSEQFNRLQYREQDLLNILCYYGNYNVRCFDHGDGPANMSAWWGLISKGEWLRAENRMGEIIVPIGEGDTPFPEADKVLKVIHMAGGSQENKMNYKTKFSDEVSARIDYLVS